ncbi:recombinase RecT [Aeromonas veronii]|uniref:RecT family recombinase n=1 Tax=Aeromonas veronii TaxID=654 RepID=UPI00222E418E|nr:RecT family recombinase [Aeromonas veronii]UZE60993.1 recombinase RecT [Aeromonas veronii]
MENTVATQSSTPVLANERGQASMLSLMMNMDFMASIDKMAAMMASGKTTVPQHLRGNQADCFAICLQAVQWGMNPFPVAQKTHLVNGTLGYEAQLVNAVVVNSGVIKGRFDYEFFGPWERVIGKFKEVQSKDPDKKGAVYRVPDWSFADEKGCGVKVIAALANGQVREVELLLQQARTRNSTLWADDPKQQLAYLGVKRWARLYTPDVILGVYSVDELEEREINPDFTPDGGNKSATENLAERAAAKRAQQQAEANKGTVIEGQAESVTEQLHSEPEPVVPDVDPEIADQLAEALFKLDIAESATELRSALSVITEMGDKLSKEQKVQANKVYHTNIARLGLDKKRAA